MIPLNRGQWAEKLAQELERPHVRVDYGNIVIWLDRTGSYNHGTIFQYGHKSHPTVVISRYSHLQVEPTCPDSPIVVVNCLPFEAMDLTQWVVQWSRCNESGVSPSMSGLVLMSKLPMVSAETLPYYRQRLVAESRYFRRVTGVKR